MTYCVAIAVADGLVFASDSRTNAGVDHINTYRKTHTFAWEGDRVLVLMSAGNLATTQAVVRQLEHEARGESDGHSLRNVAFVSEAAAYIGRISRGIQNDLCGMQQGDFNPAATFILGGQIGQGDPELYLIYPEGNFIAVSPEHPYLQIGETKYGKPILDRVIDNNTSLEDAARCALVSLDSTIRSNLTVGPPIDLLIYRCGELRLDCTIRYQEDDPYLATLRQNWSDGLRLAFNALPRFAWEATPNAIVRHE